MKNKIRFNYGRTQTIEVLWLVLKLFVWLYFWINYSIHFNNPFPRSSSMYE